MRNINIIGGRPAVLAVALVQGCTPMISQQRTVTSNNVGEVLDCDDAEEARDEVIAKAEAALQRQDFQTAAYLYEQLDKTRARGIFLFIARQFEAKENFGAAAFAYQKARDTKKAQECQRKSLASLQEEIKTLWTAVRKMEQETSSTWKGDPAAYYQRIAHLYAELIKGVANYEEFFEGFGGRGGKEHEILRVKLMILEYLLQQVREEEIMKIILILDTNGETDQAIELALKYLYRDYKKRGMGLKREEAIPAATHFLEALAFLERNGVDTRARVRFFKQLDAQGKETSGQYASAAEKYAELGNIEKAAEMYIAGGDQEKADELYRKAAESAEAEGDIRNAVLIYEKLRKGGRALSLLEEEIDTYQDADSLSFAAGVFERGGLASKARETYRQAAEAAVVSGDTELAATLYEKAKDEKMAKSFWVKTAETYAQTELLEVAAGFYEKAGDIESAKQLYLKEAQSAFFKKDFPRALDFFQRADCFIAP